MRTALFLLFIIGILRSGEAQIRGLDHPPDPEGEIPDADITGIVEIPAGVGSTISHLQYTYQKLPQPATVKYQKKKTDSRGGITYVDAHIKVGRRVKQVYAILKRGETAMPKTYPYNTNYMRDYIRALEGNSWCNEAGHILGASFGLNVGKYSSWERQIKKILKEKAKDPPDSSTTYYPQFEYKDGSRRPKMIKVHYTTFEYGTQEVEFPNPSCTQKIDWPKYDAAKQAFEGTQYDLPNQKKPFVGKIDHLKKDKSVPDQSKYQQKGVVFYYEIPKA
ncbi:hypothetical protein PROFUN_14558 [Planoprotostelium fungivorum]|uniref:Uncharacterized protein n=1 Tax=Planoprotostelium fungivorum TaxID=1890364 RepID=A0A2P6MZB0_9EUKA|nr:hypothetical protein PROFUN_14558 [Planoprotostelium fungivorum]